MVYTFIAPQQSTLIRMLYPNSQTAAIVAAVPLLRSVFVRALHSTSSLQSTTRSRRPPLATPSFPFNVQGTKPASASALSRSNEPKFTQHPSGPDKRPGQHVPTSPRRLAKFDSPPHLRRGGPMGIISPHESRDSRDSRPHQFPFSQPFTPTTYPTPLSSLPASSAQPRLFDLFALQRPLIETLKTRHGDDATTTYIQSLSLSHFLSSDHPSSRVILGAETGSGKTLAYLLPVMSHLKQTEIESSTSYDPTLTTRSGKLLPRAIVLSPTHELTRQSTAMAKGLIHGIKLSVRGMSSTKDGGVGQLRGNVDMLFGTGSMMRRMLGLKRPDEETKAYEDGEASDKHDWVGMDRVDWVVIDEADVLLGQCVPVLQLLYLLRHGTGKDFVDETMTTLRQIQTSRPNLKIILCTATFPPSLLHLLSTDPLLSSSPFTHLLSPALHKLPANLEARFVPRSGSGGPLDDVCREVKRVMAEDAQSRKDLVTASGTEIDRSKMVVFCNTDQKVRMLSSLLVKKGLPNLAWTGEAQQREKGTNGALNSFLLHPNTDVETAMVVEPGVTAPPRILVTTSLLSRGLDFSPLVSTVFLVDQPRDILDFVHRAGRAGRAGRKGRVVVFGMGDGRGGVTGAFGKQLIGVVGKKERVSRRRL